MNYPLWVVPYIGGGWVIGIIGIIHVFISHFAVGSGFYIAFTEQWAYQEKDNRIYGYLKKHSAFFLIITTLVGVVTGPGIWWSISLVGPDPTQVLIQNFTLFWGWEYMIFAAEIATFFVYYFTWERISRELHLKLAWLYAGITIFTLLIINGILTFMLTPGAWLKTGYIWDAFFNPTYWPSNFIRLFIALGLAGMFSLITSSWIQDIEFRVKMLRYSSLWFVPIFILGPIVALWYFYNIPQSAIHTIETGIQVSGTGNFSILARTLYLSMILSGTILIFVFFGPYLNPRDFSFKTAIAFLTCGLVVTGISEWTREMLRKPYTVYNYLYSNGILRDNVPKLQRVGFFESANWGKASEPQLKTPLQRGEVIFRYSCQSCHTVNGYRSMKTLLAGRNRQGIVDLLRTLRKTDPNQNPYLGIMPPLIATDDELQDLAAYLNSVQPPPQEADEPEPALPVESPGR